MADIRHIPLQEKLRISNPKVNQNFQNLNTELTGHINSTTAHKADDITYSGRIPGNDVKAALDNVDNRISEIVAQSGDDITEIVDARGGFTVLGDRLNSMDSKMTNIVSQFVDGIEYLVHYHSLIRGNQTGKIIFSGDSTTEGTGVVNPKNFIDKLAASFLAAAGKPHISTVNAGHGGKLSIDWINEYLAQDLAQDPDLYVVRWGLNDAVNPPTTRLQTFEENMTEGLTTIRAAKDVTQLSIVLMTPNTAEDREDFVRATIPIVKRLAKQFDCCFVDTYSYLQDPNSGWLDEVKLHPTDTGNNWIVNLLADVLCPSTMRGGTVLNYPGSATIKYPDDKPSTYSKGVSIFFADGTFPFAGQVVTVKSEDGICVQINTSYLSTQEGVAFRRGYSNDGVPGSIGDNWGEWIILGGGVPKQPLALLNSWEPYGADFSDAGYFKDNNGVVHLTGNIKGGLTAQFTPIASPLPVGYRPAKNTILNDKIVIGNDGSIMSWNIPDNSLVSLEGLSFKV